MKILDLLFIEGTVIRGKGQEVRIYVKSPYNKELQNYIGKNVKMIVMVIQ